MKLSGTITGVNITDKGTSLKVELLGSDQKDIAEELAQWTSQAQILVFSVVEDNSQVKLGSYEQDIKQDIKKDLKKIIDKGIKIEVK